MRSQDRPALGITGAVAGLCLGFAILAAWSPLGQQLDAFAYDFLLRLRAPSPRASAAVVLALDEPTFRAQGSMAHLRRPLTEALERVARSGAAAVAVDIQLADLYDAYWDDRLAQALAANSNLVLASNLVGDRSTGQVTWEDPRPEFGRHATLGHVHADPDPDSINRQVLLEKAGLDVGRPTRRWALALEAYRLASGGAPVVETAETLEIGPAVIPAPRREERAVRVNFSPDRIEQISVQSFLNRPELAARLRGRAVFVGVTVQGGPDRLMTPYSAWYGEATPGVLIHAELYETLARGAFLRTAPESLTLATAFLLALALAACFHFLAGARAFLAGLVLVAAGHATPVLAFARDRVMPVSPAAATAWCCFLGLGTRHYLFTRRRLGQSEAQRARYQQAVHYVTHEMRTPLTAIQGSSELMGRYTLTEEKRREMAALIHAESRRLARMIEMFLSVERLSAGELELKREPVSSAAVVETCLERAQPLAERKQIVLRFEASHGSADPVLGDREFLEYACYNLITNAIKYSPANTQILTGVGRTGDSIRITVQDQGYGMEAHEVKQIFQKFYRTRRAQESGETGTGIGLSLVEEIVLQHGGSIEVESRVNQGSRFTLVLPRARDRVAEAAR